MVSHYWFWQSNETLLSRSGGARLVSVGDYQAFSLVLASVVSDNQFYERLYFGASRLCDGDLSWVTISNQPLAVYRLVSR